MSEVDQLVDKIDELERRLIVLETTGKQRVFTGVVTTTTAAVTPIYVFSTSSDTAYTLEFSITAGRTDVPGDTASYHRKIKVKNIGGTVSALHLQETTTGNDAAWAREDNAVWAISTAVVGTTFEIRVTGVAAQTIKWSIRATVLQVNLT